MTRRSGAGADGGGLVPPGLYPTLSSCTPIIAHRPRGARQNNPGSLGAVGKGVLVLSSANTLVDQTQGVRRWHLVVGVRSRE